MMNDPYKIAKDALEQAIKTEKQNKAFMASIGPAIVSSLEPVMNELKNAVSRLKVDVLPQITVNPEVRIPEIKVPNINYTPPDVIVNYTPPKVEVNVPRVDMSSFRIPDLVWPKGDMPIRGSVSLSNIDLTHPLPVQLRDAKGNPVSLGNGGAIMGSSGGGGFREVNATIVGANGSIAATLVDSSGVGYSGSNPLSTTLALTTHLDVQQLSGSIDSVNVQQYAGNPAVVGSGYQDNAVRVVHATDAVMSVNIVGENQTLEVIQVSGGVNSVNIVGNANTLDVNIVSGAVISVNVVTDAVTLDQTTDSISVRQVSGFADSVNIVNANTLDIQVVSGAIVSVNNQQTAGNPTVVGTGYQDNALRVVHATDAVVSVNIVGENQTLEVLQVSGSIMSVSVASQPTTFDIKQLSGSVDSVSIAGNIATLDVQIVSGSIASVQVQGWNQNSGVGVDQGASSPGTLRIVHAGDVGLSTYVRPQASGDEKSSDVLRVYQVSDSTVSTQVKMLARQTNPSAAADAASNFASSDDLGRTLMRPIQVRDLTVTAYATFATGTEATLLTGVAANYLDLIYILASNNSTVAVGIDIRPSTAGSIVMHLEIPANGVVGVAPPVPIPQQATGDGTGGTWTVDLPDITGTTVSVSALFSKEV